MSADYIAYYACQQPNAVAIVNNGREVSYAELDRQIGKFTRALRQFGLPPASRVAIECDDRHIHWLLMLGFEQLGIATASFVSYEAPETLGFLAKFDLVISGHAQQVEGITRYHAITDDWVQGILAQAEDDRTEGDAADGPIGRPEETLRITRTSGTTGAVKLIALTRRVIDARVRQWSWFLGLTSRARYLASLPLSVASIYYQATACLRAGGTVVFESRVDMARALAANSITHVFLVPIMLNHVVDQLPQGFPRPTDLTITAGGAIVTAGLREKALRRLARDVHERYSTNEVGCIAAANSGASGRFTTVCPGVEIEVVGDDDAPLPFGTTGRIRARTDSMVDGYLDDPETTLRMFKDGWFYPGDLGILHGPRQLQIVAREDELLNIGGIKIAPGDLEERLLKDAAISDAGICSIRSAAGIEEVWVGVVALSSDDTALLGRIDLAFRPFQLGKFHIRKLALIPRNAAGKIDRVQLRSALTAGLPEGKGAGRA